MGTMNMLRRVDDSRPPSITIARGDCSLIMLSKVMTPRLLGTFIGIVVGGIVFIGYFFNMIW